MGTSVVSAKKISSADLSTITRAVETIRSEVSAENLQNAQEAEKISNVAVANNSSVSAKVVRVVDGDTIVLDSGEKVRYIGVNTPELHHPQKGVECFGKEAYERNKILVEGKVVQLQKDVSETDRYGRLLRYVWVDGTLVNESLVREGYAFAASFPPDIAMQKYFEVAQQTARENRTGLWSSCPKN